jgi:hypothetical protein
MLAVYSPLRIRHPFGIFYLKYQYFYGWHDYVFIAPVSYLSIVS